MSSDDSLAAFLESVSATSDAVAQAMRYRVIEHSDYLPISDMKEEILRFASNPIAAQEELNSLCMSEDKLQQIASLYLTIGWEDPEERKRIKSALTEAERNLPVIDYTVMAIVAMYAMYLLVTGGRAKSTRKIKRGPDGSYEETETITYASVSDWLRTLQDLFLRSGPGSGS